MRGVSIVPRPKQLTTTKVQTDLEGQDVERLGMEYVQMSDFQTEMQAWTNQLLQVLVLSCDWNALLEQAAWQPLCPNDDMQKKMLCASLRQRSQYVNQLTQAIAKLERLMTSELSSTLAKYLWTFGEHLHKTMRRYEEGFPGRNTWPLSCMTGLAPRSVPNAASHGHLLRMDVMLFNDWVLHTSPVTGIAEGAGPESAWFLVQLPVSQKLRLEKVWREEIMESQEPYWTWDEFILTAIDFGSTVKQRVSMRPANIRRDATADATTVGSFATNFAAG